MKTLKVSRSAGGGGINVGDATNLVYGVLIVVFLVAEPRGLIGLVARAIRSFPQRRRPAQASIAVSSVTEE